MPRPLIAVARHLADLLDRENTALKSMDLRQAVRLLPEKSAAIADLMASGESALLPPHPALIEVAQLVDSLALENRQLLERAIVAQQRVIGIVVRAVAAISTDPYYGAGGRQGSATGPMTLSTRA